MRLIDTHCHIHDPELFSTEQAELAYKEAIKQLEALILVGTSLKDSKQAISFAEEHSSGCFVAIGIHPHDAGKMTADQIKKDTSALSELVKNSKVKSIGECGFDFYYNDLGSSLKLQTKLLESQLQIAQDNNLPVCFHVREAFDQFWPVFNNFSGLRGVLHSFSDKQANLNKALNYGLMVGINGIATFTKHDWQIQLFKDVPLESMVLETDSPFLTPSPIRGTINKPINVTYITEFLAELRGANVKDITTITTRNAQKLFGL